MGSFLRRFFGNRQILVEGEKRPKNVLVMVAWDDCAGNEELISQIQKKGTTIATEMVSGPDFRITKIDEIILAEFNKQRIRDATFLDRAIFVEKDEQLRARAVERHPNLIVGVQDLQEAVEAIEKI